MFPDASDRLVQQLREQDRFVLLCDHGGGHSVPADAQQSVWRSFTDHPYGTQPSPYASGIPDGFVAYCAPRMRLRSRRLADRSRDGGVRIASDDRLRGFSFGSELA